MTLDPQILRRRPQLAAVEMLTHTLETTLVALCAAHPLIELAPRARTEPILPTDHLADRAVERAIELLDALDCYRLGQYDLEHAPRRPPDDNLF